MSLHNILQNLKTQIIETERMLSIVGNHPIMSVSLNKKLHALKEELANLPSEVTESKITLLFSGKAVVGSLGIKSDFVSKTIKPICELIKIQTALIKCGGDIGKRGKVKKNNLADLYLSALPTGSFGYELSLLESKELFDEEDVAASMKSVITIIESTTKSNDDFEKIIENVPPRYLANLSSFLKEVSEEDSILKMESGNLYIKLSEIEVKNGYIRTSSTYLDEKKITIPGRFKGILLDSCRFEIESADGQLIKGYVSEDISEEEAIRYNKEFSNEECNIILEESIITYNGQRRKITYELIQIRPL